VDTTELRRRYDDLIAVAGSVTFATPVTGWSARMVVAHLVLHDRLLLDGFETGTFDGAPALDEERVRAEPDPLRGLERSSADLVAYLAALSTEAAEREIAVSINGRPAEDQLSIHRVVDVHTYVHLPGRFEQLQSLRIPPRGAPKVRVTPRQIDAGWDFLHP